jgi:hypothetical protein
MVVQKSRVSLSFPCFDTHILLEMARHFNASWSFPTNQNISATQYGGVFRAIGYTRLTYLDIDNAVSVSQKPVSRCIDIHLTYLSNVSPGQFLLKIMYPALSQLFKLPFSIHNQKQYISLAASFRIH